jgi:hypothetical protein
VRSARIVVRAYCVLLPHSFPSLDCVIQPTDGTNKQGSKYRAKQEKTEFVPTAYKGFFKLGEKKGSPSVEKKPRENHHTFKHIILPPHYFTIQ